ncbi:MAG TPA: tetratricopeptide repeat protein [Candidatus Omnitrophota bacterium]|nr:tetratricopeptide repeat protein [Candidatus Omnitrophota bacterium]HPS37450.1 tetratricopeptide repeat protein [Candidatus Omnitrophota bacterium]
MKTRVFLGALITLLGVSQFHAFAAQKGGTVFEEANTSYRTGNYEKAAGLYERLTHEGAPVAAVYYDLGNAYVRLGKLSQAILNYEKALLIDPRNADIRYNLNYARGLIEYRVEDSRNWYLKATAAVLRFWTRQEIHLLTQVLVFIFLLGGILRLLSGRDPFWTAWRKCMFALVLIAFLVEFGKHVQDNLFTDAIVMQKECEARYGPSEHDQVAFRMGEGIKVFVVDRREDWSRVVLTNGESGWVKNEDIAEVKL